MPTTFGKLRDLKACIKNMTKSLHLKIIASLQQKLIHYNFKDYIGIFWHTEYSLLYYCWLNQKNLEQRYSKCTTVYLHIHTRLDICDNCSNSFGRVIESTQLKSWICGPNSTAKLLVFVSSFDSYHKHGKRTRASKTFLNGISNGETTNNEKFHFFCRPIQLAEVRSN